MLNITGNKIRHIGIIFYLFFTNSVFANQSLPTINVGNSTNSNDYIQYMKDIGWGLAALAALALCLYAFYSVVDGLISRFNEWKRQNATLGEVIIMGLMGVGLLIFSVFLLIQVTSAMGIEFGFN